MSLAAVARYCVLLAACVASTALADQGDEMMRKVMSQCPGAASYMQRMEADAISRRDAGDAGMSPASAPPLHPELRDELLEMSRQDQAARLANLQDPTVWQQIAEVDARNLTRFKQIISAHGFPDRTLVGSEGFGAAWLLVQHADSDPSFQQHMLELMIERHLIEGEQLAMLTDRVLRAQGKPQRYGSQFMEAAGRQAPQPIEEPFDKLDERRASMGMMPFADYRCTMDVMYPAREQ
jgi:hypothetical protein